MSTQYFGGVWESHEDIVSSFSEYTRTEADIALTLALSDVIVAAYDLGGYDGSAYVLYRKDGKLYEVFGGHCSCHGLEGQWDPEETTKEAILARYKVTSGYTDFDDQVRSVVEAL